MIEPFAANTAAAVSIDDPAVTAATPTAAAGDAPGIRAQPASSTEIHISAPGHALAGGGQAPAVRDNSDVDSSGLPDQAKDAIKRLRELRAQLERKLQELEAVKNATTGTPDQKRVRIAALQQEISGLGAAINSTTAILNQAIRKLSAEQQLQAGSLAMN
ncbi:hypothetical protein [Cupriavidus sp. TMH.W2]|uniref:hypothetical protein n=1 Tax=Cupriavidus sp. TMH.W2 TaxID=3434465 RepID=UPI003D774153